MLTRADGVRVLGRGDLPAFVELAERDPVVNVFVLHRAELTGLEPRWLGGEIWGRFDEDGRLTAACHNAANLVPIGCTPHDAAAFARRGRRRRRTASTIVGPRDQVQWFWDGLEGAWGSPRDERWDQPHLELAAAPQVRPDPEVAPTSRADFDELYRACVEMYTEEVGVSPEEGGGADLYRARVCQLQSRGWSFARFDRGRLVFKAEVACATRQAAQIQGVWVDPARRGEGLATAGMAAVVELVRRRIAPTVSLYVNDWNHPARAAYAKVGFTETARFATLMW